LLHRIYVSCMPIHGATICCGQDCQKRSVRSFAERYYLRSGRRMNWCTGCRARLLLPGRSWPRP